jgi:hypothetical protein
VSHHVIVGLPDGRAAIADYRQPVVHVMQRVHARIPDAHPDVAAQQADLALIADWLDRHPEQACTREQFRDGTCTHPPALAEPYRPPRYRPDSTPAPARPAEERRAA